ncbi:hypothetical protein FM036_36875, partial [Nostoc sp. HG1]|nr:hypothetical protein [Nostoc sp. HG1]
MQTVDNPDRSYSTSKITTPAPERIIEATGLALNQKRGSRPDSKSSHHYAPYSLVEACILQSKLILKTSMGLQCDRLQLNKCDRIKLTIR